MRILHITEAAEYGVLRHISLVSEELQRRGHQCIALLYGSRIDEKAALPFQCIVHRQTGGRFWNLLDSISLIRGTVAKLKPDVVHLHAFAAGVAGRLALRGCVYSPHAFAVHDCVPWHVRKLSLIAERLLHCRTGKYALVSESERNEAKSILGLPCGKLHVCRNGLPRNFSEGLYSRDEARRRLCELCPGMFADACRTGVFPGRLAAQKNPDVVLDAIDVLGAESPRIVFCGDGPLFERLRARGSEHVFFAGKVPELRRYLRAFDFAVMPSRYEGLSYAFLECLAAGLPVAATDAVEVEVSSEYPVKSIIRIGSDNADADSVAKAMMTASNMSSQPSCLPFALERQVDSLMDLYGNYL